jgi:hypothetical protein
MVLRVCLNFKVGNVYFLSIRQTILIEKMTSTGGNDDEVRPYENDDVGTKSYLVTFSPPAEKPMMRLRGD